MRIVEPGRVYELAGGNDLVFLRKEGGTIQSVGTTNEEVLEVLIDRATEAYRRLPCQETVKALYLLGEALAAFQRRAKHRLAANVEGTHLPHDPTPEVGSDPKSRLPTNDADALDQAPN